jgi:hypothetical protein
VPLIPFEYYGQEYRICTAHLPMLLHKPEMFEGKLVDAGKNWSGDGENHHEH